MLPLVYEDIVEAPIVRRGGAAAHNRINGTSAGPWQSSPIDDRKNWTLI